MAEFDWFQRQDSSESSDAQQPDDALDWAKQAYARLKAQQEAEKSAAAAPPAPPDPDPAATPARAAGPAPEMVEWSVLSSVGSSGGAHTWAARRRCRRRPVVAAGALRADGLHVFEGLRAAHLQRERHAAIGARRRRV